MDATALLEHDHEKVERLFTQFEESDDTATKGEVMTQIAQELDLHARIEEQVFYPAVQREAPEGEELVREGIEEHKVVKQLLRELQAMTPDDPQFEAKATVLMENVRHHVEEEEDDLFPQVRGDLGADRLEQLGAELLRAKGLDPAALQAVKTELLDLTKEELYDKAQELEIDGRSDMSKDELVDAITARSL